MRLLEPTRENLSLAAETIRRGGLVVMPTETVYGLACDATNPEAVARVFEAKRRPADNPLIVHIADVAQLADVSSDVPTQAEALAERFWPGPLTLVVPRGDRIPRLVTAGLDTVAVRMPAHPVALGLIEASSVPVAAPSANLYGRLSPTLPGHLDPDLSAFVEIVLDGGRCEVGIESTVLDLTIDPPTILRPGVVSSSDLRECLGTEVVLSSGHASRKSPGTHHRHYAPRTPLRLVDRLGPDDAGLTFSTPSSPRQIRMPMDPALYAARLYSALHELDRMGEASIAAETPPEDEVWRPVLDRLARASHRA